MSLPSPQLQLPWARKLEGAGRESTGSSGKATRARAPRLTSRLLLIPDDGRETQGRQEEPGTISSGQAEKGPMRTGGGPAGLGGGQRCSEERAWPLEPHICLPWDGPSSQPGAGSSWIPGLSQHLPQREFIKQGLPLCGYGCSLLARPGSGVRGDSSGRQGPRGRGKETVLPWLCSCALSRPPQTVPPLREGGRIWAVGAPELGPPGLTQERGWWSYISEWVTLEQPGHSPRDLEGSPEGPGARCRSQHSTGILGRPQQTAHPPSLRRLGPCQGPQLLFPVTFTGWEVATES